MPPAAPKLLDQVRDKLRAKHYSIRIEEQYSQWIRRFILFHDKRHPKAMGAPEVEAFLSHADRIFKRPFSLSRTVALRAWVVNHLRIG